MEPDYEAIERKVETDMVRTELEPTPGGWWVQPRNGRLEAIGGRCCLFSPQVLGELSGDISSRIVLHKLGVDTEWMWNAIDGFDGHTEGSGTPGYAFGAEMRRKYVTDPSAAQEAADARHDREVNR